MSCKDFSMIFLETFCFNTSQIYLAKMTIRYLSDDLTWPDGEIVSQNIFDFVSQQEHGNVYNLTINGDQN